ncbi:MAG TPA: DNA-processing protein DprA [Tenuifilaceae bacterium]|nr:DNA-processing protein DprA [Tenuifilaceae bacterium]
MTSNNDPDLIYKIGIGLIPKIGSISAKKLIAYCGSAQKVFELSKKELMGVPGIGKILADEIVKQKVLPIAEREIKFIQKYNVKTYYFTDPEYPNRLKHCEDGPIILFVKSNININFNADKILSVVGTRKATDYGKNICEEIIGDLAKMGHSPIIISGLAYGIDITAHRAALKNGLQTIAVLGHGFSTIYPSAHKNTAKDIVNSGALVTDFESEAIFDRKNFLQRNRIIAGLSDATVVVESAPEGGAMITADIANSYNREVFAVPGNVWNNYSKGCNLLIKQNKAALIENATDIEYMLGWKINNDTKQKQLIINFDSFTSDEQKIINLLKEKGEESIDVIALITGIPVSKVLSSLLNLEFSGIIISKPGKVFALKS